MLPILAATLLAFEADSAQQEDLPAAHVVRSYTGTVHLTLWPLRAGVELYGGAGDALSTDPLKQEDFVAPEFSWLVNPRCTLKAQFSKALRAESDDVALLVAAFTF